MNPYIQDIFFLHTPANFQKYQVYNMISIFLLSQIAKGAEKAGKTLNENLFIIPDRKQAIRRAFKTAQKGDIVLLLGKSHENSIIYKDFVMPYDEIKEAEKALSELG